MSGELTAQGDRSGIVTTRPAKVRRRCAGMKRLRTFALDTIVLEPSPVLKKHFNYGVCKILSLFSRRVRFDDRGRAILLTDNQDARLDCDFRCCIRLRNRENV